MGLAALVDSEISIDSVALIDSGTSTALGLNRSEGSDEGSAVSTASICSVAERHEEIQRKRGEFFGL